MDNVVFDYDLAGIEIEVLVKFSHDDKCSFVHGYAHQPEITLLEAVCKDGGVINTDEAYVKRNEQLIPLTEELELLAWEKR